MQCDLYRLFSCRKKKSFVDSYPDSAVITNNGKALLSYSIMKYRQRGGMTKLFNNEVPTKGRDDKVIL